MINIIHINIHCDDDRHVTTLEIKLKSCPQEQVNENHQHLVARASAAFHALDLFSEYGKALKTELNPKRLNVVNMVVTLYDNNLSFRDISEFIDAFQKELDESPF